MTGSGGSNVAAGRLLQERFKMRRLLFLSSALIAMEVFGKLRFHNLTPSV
jgi:hypothetical protein